MFVFPSAVHKIFEAVERANGRAFVVGGSVRDAFLGLPVKDYDIEVYGLSPETLMTVLSTIGKVDAVGVSFGVLKVRVDDMTIDVSLPRRDSKAGTGHKGFNIVADPTMTPTEAASRRDFTINGMMVDSNGEIFDPFSGLVDINNRVLRATSADTFADDTLRVLRGFQFVARFGFTVSEDTIEYCRKMGSEFSTLSTERIWGEWDKWALKGIQPSLGLRFLRACAWDEKFPEIHRLIGVPQDPEWHPEGDCFEHVCHVVDAAATIAAREQLSDDDRRTLMFTALCHDFGKPSTTKYVDGKIRSFEHAVVGVKFARSFLTSIGAPLALIERVAILTERHLAHIDYIKNGASERVVRRLSKTLADSGTTMRMLGWVIEADHSGRPPLKGGMPPDMRAMLEVAEKLAVTESGPKPLLYGRHLIELGMTPSKLFGVVLKHCFQAQLDGTVTTVEEAKAEAANFLKRRITNE
jgi:tRNA nucleotidyltransferase (CCA-adding enzyme)